MAGVSRFEDLVAWQKARKMTAAIYQVSSKPLFQKDFALVNQLRKAAISVPSNIAEGFERGKKTEFHQFLSIAKASCAEVRTQLYIAFDVGYLTQEEMAGLLKQAEEVSRILGGLRASVARPVKVR